MSDPLSLAGLPVVLIAESTETSRLAAAELGRYLYLLSGHPAKQLESMPKQGDVIVLDEDTRCSEQGYRVAVKRRGSFRSLVIGASTGEGLLYGVYGLLERLGMGFYAGGDTFPEIPAELLVDGDLEMVDEPVITARGNMLHYNFLCGCTNWGLEDYKFYLDQLARQRMNVLLMHWYDGEPGAAHELDGEFLAGGTTPNSLTKPWGALEGLRTAEFSYGVGRVFSEDVWTSPAGEGMPDPITEIQQTEAVFRAATRYACVRGVRVAAGFEAPSKGDPTDAETVARFKDRVAKFVLRNPDLGYFALWQHESGGCVGSTPPAKDSAAGKLMASRRDLFAHLGNERRIWEAVRYGEFGVIACEVLVEIAPELPVVMVGWGGDEWMRFADYCLGYDSYLPAHVVFTCHDNIDATMGEAVSGPWGELSPERERWAMPWVEGDLNDCWTRQNRVEVLGKLAVDAQKKGCQGLLNLQWRTRDLEEENGYIASFAWDTEMTPQAFYEKLGRDSFGPALAETGAEIIGGLQRLGARSTGMQGTAECSRMTWTGWDPHFPFELDESAPGFLAPLADELADVLSRVPEEDDDPQAGAFHVRTDSKAAGEVDESRFGVAEARALAQRLRDMEGTTGEKALRKALTALRRDAYAFRYELVTQGLVGPGYRAVDHFLLALNHLVTVAGYEKKSAAVETFRTKAEGMREEIAGHRLDRLEFLTASMDVVLHLDAVASLLADGELVDQAQEAIAGAPDEAATIAAEAYEVLMEADMRGMMLAQTRKLTTRCEFGVLATMAIKPMPKYWQAVATLEELMPAAPPREVSARGLEDEVWLSWSPGKGALCLLWRRAAGDDEWEAVNERPLAGGTRMYLDRPGEGAWEYAVSMDDGAGFESPLSHVVQTYCGDSEVGPKIYAVKPYSHVWPGEPYQQRVVVQSDRELTNVSLVFRCEPGGEWWSAPMQHRFRNSYQGIVPGEQVVGDVLEFFVYAEDDAGNGTSWPAGAEEGVPWSMSVVG